MTGIQTDASNDRFYRFYFRVGSHRSSNGRGEDNMV
jgi:hypothetical protein